MRKVKPGDPLAIRAEDWNQLAEAAEYVARQRQEGKGQRLGLGNGIIRVVNYEDKPLPIYTVVTLKWRSKEVPNYDDETADVPIDTYYQGKLPTWKDAPYAVLQEPLEPGQIGRAMVYGITPVRLSGIGPFAEPIVDPNAAGMLRRGDSGSARVLCDQEPDSAWGIVLLGGGGGGSGGGSDVCLCEISENSTGTGGYPVKVYSVDDDGTAIGESMLFLTEIALGSKLPVGTRLLGHTVALRATGGNE